jgi:hypothetical protein
MITRKTVPHTMQVTIPFILFTSDCQLNYTCATKELPVHLEHLLQFMTGADSIPPLGFPELLSIIFYDQENGTTRYPYSSTCAMT